jgi:hypothetical protein
MGGAFSTGGRGAHGDFTGVGGPGGFATNTGFSDVPLSTRPLPVPPTIPPSFIVDVGASGAGDAGFGVGFVDVTGGVGLGGSGAGSSTCWGRVILVPSVHSIVSGAQSSSSSSISAQFACLEGSSD